MTSADRQLAQLHDLWDRLGRDDPLWAVLTRPDKRGGRWEPEQFLATGRQEVEQVVERLRALGVSARGERALDFGCGAGRLTQAWAHHYSHVVGVDIAESMIAAARALAAGRPECEFVHNPRGDLASLDSGTFDLVYSNIVLQHIPPDLALAYVAEFGRVLRDGGLAVFSAPSARRRTGVGRLRAVLPQPVVEAYKRKRDPSRIAMHLLPPDRVRSVAAAAGLDLVDQQPDTSGGADWPGFCYVFARRPPA